MSDNFLKWLLGALVEGEDTSDSNPYPVEDDEEEGDQDNDEEQPE